MSEPALQLLLHSGEVNIIQSVCQLFQKLLAAGGDKLLSWDPSPTKALQTLLQVRIPGRVKLDPRWYPPKRTGTHPTPNQGLGRRFTSSALRVYHSLIPQPVLPRRSGHRSVAVLSMHGP